MKAGTYLKLPGAHNKDWVYGYVTKRINKGSYVVQWFDEKLPRIAESYYPSAQQEVEATFEIMVFRIINMSLRQ